MEVTGRCYCGAVQYKASGDPLFQGQCHCRECQYVTGGSPALVLGMPQFSYTQGSAKGFTRSDIPNPVTREFCPECGTHLLTRAPGMGEAVILKVGTMDEPSLFSPQMAIYTCDAQPFHHVPTTIPTFEKRPG